MNAQYKKGALEICVLSQLVGQDRYGYELTENISKTMTIAGGTLYPILRKLKEDELVTTYLVDTGTGPARKYYRITEKGRSRQAQLRNEWEEFTHAVQLLMDGGSLDCTEKENKPFLPSDETTGGADCSNGIDIGNGYEEDGVCAKGTEL